MLIRYDLEDNGSRRMRRLRASLDTRDQGAAELPKQKVSFHVLEQRRRGRQDMGSVNQGTAQPHHDRLPTSPRSAVPKV